MGGNQRVVWDGFETEGVVKFLGIEIGQAVKNVKEATA